MRTALYTTSIERKLVEAKLSKIAIQKVGDVYLLPGSRTKVEIKDGRTTKGVEMGRGYTITSKCELHIETNRIFVEKGLKRILEWIYPQSVIRGDALYFKELINRELAETNGPFG